MDYGLEQGGLTVQQSWEIDPTCCATLRQNFQHDVTEMDIKLKLVRDERECHVMVATYPCTKYSPIAGTFMASEPGTNCSCISFVTSPSGAQRFMWLRTCRGCASSPS